MHNAHSETDAARAAGDLYMIPFHVGSQLVLRSTLNPALKAKTIVYGAVPSQMVIIEEPLFALNERFAGQHKEFLCVYMQGNHLFKFKSKFLKHLFKNVIGINYPVDLERVQFRSSTRIPVNIETEVHVPKKSRTISVDMADISEGGCRLELAEPIQIQRGATLYINFTLPFDESIDNLVCTVMNVKPGYRNLAIGVRFHGPSQTIMKIKKFCRLCFIGLTLGNGWQDQC